MINVALITLRGVALAAPRAFFTAMRGLPSAHPPDVPHRYDQPPNVLTMHSRYGWHCVCNGTHPEPCWCNTLTAVPVIPGRET